MTNYFLKYTHSRDEIKRNDRCLFEGQYLIVGEFTHDDTVCFVNEDVEQEIPEAAFRRTAIKVNLFLCDRIIDIGDKVIELHNHHKYRHFTVTEKYEDKNMDGNPILMIGDYSESVDSNCVFKPIAEVSKKVTWKLEDGQKIDPLDFKLQMFEHNTRLPNYDFHGIALIKNPSCKHYH